VVDGGVARAVTSTLELMVAVRPTFHEPALLAKQAANIDHISDGRLTLNVVSSWWADERSSTACASISTTSATRARANG
jgi:FMNH2-dependent dimethyl sulfone monooxygenase